MMMYLSYLLFFSAGLFDAWSDPSLENHKVTYIGDLSHLVILLEDVAKLNSVCRLILQAQKL